MIKLITKTFLPTKYGKFKLYLYNQNHPRQEHLALVFGNIAKSKKSVLTRIHSACLTGDVFGSRRCDCNGQLHLALKKIKIRGAGVIIYLDQEGRGIGLSNKIKAYALQDRGLDTVEANVRLGFKPDERDFGAAADILKNLEVKEIELLTNSPQKISDLKKHGLRVTRARFWIKNNPHNSRYLKIKQTKMDHLS